MIQGGFTSPSRRMMPSYNIPNTLMVSNVAARENLEIRASLLFPRYRLYKDGQPPPPMIEAKSGILIGTFSNIQDTAYINAYELACRIQNEDAAKSVSEFEAIEEVFGWFDFTKKIKISYENDHIVEMAKDITKEVQKWEDWRLNLCDEKLKAKASSLKL